MTKPKVLIVEDDISIGVVVSAALAAENIDTQICDTVSARDAALANDVFDLMLTDVILKDNDGLETLKEAMAGAPDMPVIIMSAQNTLETAVRASEKTVSLKPAMLNRFASVTALPPIWSAEVSGITLLFPSSSVPRMTLVVPA